MDPHKRTIIDKHSSKLQSFALDLAFSVLDEFYRALSERLMDEADASSSQQQWQVLSLVRAVKESEAKLSQCYENYIMEGFIQFRIGRLGGENTDAEDQSTNLALVATDELERDIAITSLARRAETRHMETLFALNQRLAVVNGGKKLPEDGSPLGPLQFAEALGALMAPLELSNKHLVLFCRVFEPILLRHLEVMYNQANDYLIESGILPNLRYGISKRQQVPERLDKSVESQSDISEEVSDQYFQQAQQSLKNSAPASAASGGNIVAENEVVSAPAATSGPAVEVGDDSYQQKMFNAIRQLQNQTAAGAENAITASSANSSSGSDAVLVPSEQLVSVLNASPVIQQHAEALEAEAVQPLTVEHYHAVAQKMHEQLDEDHRIESGDSHAIDLVGMIFEYMLGDELLPDSLKAVLSYLHTPFLKIALLEPEFFEQAKHPARQLLNLLADSGRRWVNSDGDSQFKIFPKIKSIVRRAVMDFDNDVAIFEELLLEMEEFHSKITHKIGLLEKRAQEKAEGEERLRDAKRRVYSEIKRRMERQDVPPAVIVLLLHPWADFLTFELLRFGTDSEQWRRGLQMVENILWSLEPKAEDVDRSRLILMQTEMHQQLREAIKTISFNQPKAMKLLSILETLQNQAVAASLPQVEVAGQAEMACEQALLEEPDSFGLAEEHKLEVVSSRSIEGSEEFTPESYPEEMFEELDESLYSEAEKELVEYLRHIDFGTQFEFDELDGKKNQRLKVAWYNLKTMRYMLVDNAGRKVTMTSAIDIARMVLNSQARMISISGKPFFERALENILVRLKAMHL